jgi:hypothetical protein
VKRVLVVASGTIVGLGLRELLREEHRDVIAEETPVERLVEHLNHEPPDVVVIEEDDGDQLPATITTSFPSVTVISCSGVNPTMHVYPAFHHGESYQSTLSPERLIQAVMRG